MTKELSPLRRKDIETGRKLERDEIVKWLRSFGQEDGEVTRYLPGTLATLIKSGMHKL